jgi:hypothetical protein
MTVIQRLDYVCKISLPAGEMKRTVIPAFSAAAAKRIAEKRFPKAKGILILGIYDQYDQSIEFL